MQYTFDNFQFDVSQQVLSKNGKIVPLKHNEAKLLSLFLSRPDEILSKETILNEVWGDRVVSEQVVFQNISQLRTILSDKSIRTFPKKGYQWQIEAQVNSSDASVKGTSIKASPSFWWLILVACVSLFLLFKLKDIFSDNATVVKTNIMVIPFQYDDLELSGSLTNPFNQVLKTVQIDESFKLRWSEAELNPRSFFNSPLLTWQGFEFEDRELLLSGFVKQQEDGLLLRYRLQGAFRAWEGYLFTTSSETLIQQLHIRLTRILGSQYLTLKKEALITPELTLLHNLFPDDNGVLLRLIERQVAQKNYDIAMALVDRLIEQTDLKQDTAYLGSGYMLKGKILHLRGMFEQAELFYIKSHEVFATRDLLHLQSKVSKNQGWLGYFRKDYKQVKAALYQAASQAKLAGEPLAEIEAYTLQSILASKMGYKKEKYDHLYKAQSLLLDYQLDKANFAVIFYHFALFAETQQDAKPYFEKVLNLPYKPENSWIVEDTQDNLAQYYIEQNVWEQALALFPDQQNSAFSNNQRAKIYFYMNDLTEAVNYAKLAFSQARINYKFAESLNSALLLYRISIKTDDVKGEVEYKDYIENNASKQWLSSNHDVLSTLGDFDTQNMPPEPQSR